MENCSFAHVGFNVYVWVNYIVKKEFWILFKLFNLVIDLK